MDVFNTIELLEAWEEAAEAREAAKQALDIVVPSVGLLVRSPGRATVRLGRNDKLEAELRGQLPGLVAVMRSSSCAPMSCFAATKRGPTNSLDQHGYSNSVLRNGAVGDSVLRLASRRQ